MTWLELLVSVIKAIATGLGLIRDENLIQSGENRQKAKDDGAIVNAGKVRSEEDAAANRATDDDLRGQLMRDGGG